MSEAATHSNSSLDTRTIVHRRLVGLAVLLLALFLLSLLLRTGNRSGDGLPSVVIALNGSGATVDPVASTAAPTLDAQEEELPEQAAPAPSKAEPATAAVVETPKPAAPSKPPPSTAAATKPREKPVAKPAVPAPLPSPAAKSADARRWFVVIGSYKDQMAAQAIANRVKLAGLKAAATPITAAGEKLHRVRAGPFVSKDDAESARATLIVEGLTKATIVGEK